MTTVFDFPIKMCGDVYIKVLLHLKDALFHTILSKLFILKWPLASAEFILVYYLMGYLSLYHTSMFLTIISDANFPYSGEL